MFSEFSHVTCPGVVPVVAAPLLQLIFTDLARHLAGDAGCHPPTLQPDRLSQCSSPGLAAKNGGRHSRAC